MGAVSRGLHGAEFDATKRPETSDVVPLDVLIVLAKSEGRTCWLPRPRRRQRLAARRQGVCAHGGLPAVGERLSQASFDGKDATVH